MRGGAGAYDRFPIPRETRGLPPGRAILPELTDSLTAGLDALLAGLPPRRRLVVGVSGGLDSMVLLALLRECTALPLLAVHVHHGLSPRADAWAEHVTQWCAAAGVPSRVLRVTVDRARPSLEAAARDARHAALAGELQPGDALLLAHHADDQAETLLLRLLRGSGLAGLGAMRPLRALSSPPDAYLLRPLLGVTRARLEAEATRRGLAWVEDESNADRAFDRNFLRHAILPSLHERWPAATATLADTARRLADADALLNDYLDADLAPLLVPVDAAYPALAVAGLLAHPAPRRTALLRRWLARLDAPLFHEAWLAQLLALAAAREDSEGELRVAGWEMHRYRDCLHAFPVLPPPAGEAIDWTLDGSLDLGPAAGRLQVLPATADTGLPLAGLVPGMAVTVRFRAGGERLAPAGGVGHRPLKKILQDLHLPPWLRARVPLLYMDGQCVAVGDRLAAAGFAPAPDRPPALRLAWCPPGRAG